MEKRPQYSLRYNKSELKDLIKKQLDEGNYFEDSLIKIANLFARGHFAYDTKNRGYIENPTTDSSVRYERIKKGDQVIVEEPYEFMATVAGFKDRYVVIVDQEDNAFDVEPHRLIKDE